MALTFNTATVLSARVAQANFLIEMTIDLDNSYPTGGWDVSTILGALDNSYTVLDIRVRGGVPQGGAGHTLVYNKATDKLMAFVNSTGAEAANALDFSGVTGLRVVVDAE